MSKLAKTAVIIKDIGCIIADLVKSQVDHGFDQLEEMQTRVINQAMLILAAVLLMTGGLGMIIYSIHILLSAVIPPAASGLILGLIMILSSIITIFIAENSSKG